MNMSLEDVVNMTLEEVISSAKAPFDEVMLWAIAKAEEEGKGGDCREVLRIITADPAVSEPIVMGAIISVLSNLARSRAIYGLRQARPSATPSLDSHGACDCPDDRSRSVGLVL